ncbi:MAG: hypothetical protein GX864_03840 [Mollicutes bacterium]|nr:hypothetical protein [Mollicutes bacterium]
MNSENIRQYILDLINRRINKGASKQTIIELLRYLKIIHKNKLDIIIFINNQIKKYNL